VSEERVCLPDGPGSLEGIGENVSVNANMGQMSYSVPIQVPAGYAGMTPSVGLSYSSGAGGSVVGIGWSLPTPTVERATRRGLPRYTLDDQFVADGGDQLVLLPGTNPPVYRARFEKGFVRYAWLDAGDGGEGYWQAEYPDGRVGTFGATADGTLEPASRLSGDQGTFRYHLVEMRDRYDHRIRYHYRSEGTARLLERVEWVFAQDTPVYAVRFAYDAREDLLSDCKPGFCSVLGQRLARVEVLARQTVIRTYELTYESYDNSGGFSRLVDVQLYGALGGRYPAHHGFEYSRSLGAECGAGADCRGPYVETMGTLGVNLLQGDATLLDINGDALPDVVDTTRVGEPHRIFLNTLLADGSHFFAESYESAVGAQGTHDLSSGYVQVLDVDGDGFTDMLNYQSGLVLHNLGQGDWEGEPLDLWGGGGHSDVPDLEGDLDMADGELRTVRFLDYDGDKRIDAMRSHDSGPSNVTQVFRNNGQGSFVLDPDAEPLGAGFESDSLELNDMNGDGLLDAVQVTPTLVRYRLNLGWGRWEPWVTVVGFDFTNQEAIRAELDDLNGDGVTDLVLVAGNMVRYWLNRNGRAFDPERRITSADVAGELPVRTAETTVLYADMNGNGSTDVVWIDAQGLVTYLELFPVRPNLLSRIENGLGRVSDIAYGTSVQHMARTLEEGGSWDHRLPQPMNVVDQVDEWQLLHPEVHSVMEYRYDDGRYDGAEKQFRGYARVAVVEPPQGEDLEGLTLSAYNVGLNADGDNDPYLAGLTQSEEVREDDRTLSLHTNEWGDCPVAGVPEQGLRFPVRHICRLSETTELREGLADPARWVTSEVHYAYDGYGNVTLASDLGVVSIGGGGCPQCAEPWLFGAPCGPECLGDEQYTATEHLDPQHNGDRWLLSLPTRSRTFGLATPAGEPAGDTYMEVLTYYDGPAFEGLPLGQATHGAVTRVNGRVARDGTVVDQERHRIDEHGNVVETLDALGAPGATTHRTRWTMDALGLRVTAAEVPLEDGRGPYVVRREVSYDPLWDKPTEGTAWMLVVGGQVQSGRQSSLYSYDEFGRLVARVQPGEADGQATQEYSYELASPASRIVARSRSQAGGPLDLVQVRCLDGRGRAYQDRLKVQGEQYRVSGFTVFDHRGKALEVFQPYESAGDACDAAPPAGTLSRRNRYDIVGRLVEQIHPPAANDGEGGPTRSLTVYGPLTEERWDREDTRAGGPHAGTPLVLRHNGLGQVVAVQANAGGDQPAEQYGLAYDQLGRLIAVTDPAGNVKRQHADLRGLVTRVEDPDSGLTLFEYDAAGNVLAEEDARGVVTLRAYDGSNRLQAEWQQDAEADTLIEYAYDRPSGCPADLCSNAAGRLVSITYPLAGGAVGQDRVGYTVRGREHYTSRLLAGRVLETRAEFDNADRLVATTYPNGLRVAYTLDGAGRLRAVPGYVAEVSYDERGDLSTLRMANGVLTERLYDERRRFVGLRVGPPGGDPVLALSYDRDREGNLLQLVDERVDVADEPLASARYAYDGLYRLTEALLDPGRAAQEETLTFRHGPANLLLSQTSSRGAQSPAHVGDYRYGGAAGPHAVVQAGAVGLGYDPAGNLTRRGDVQLEWDFLGRLSRASRADEELVSYGYAGNGDRVLKREPGATTYYAHPEFEVRDGVATVYVRVDESRLVRVEDPTFAAAFYTDLAPAEGPDDDLSLTPDGLISAGDAWVAVGLTSAALTTADPAGETPSPARDLLRASARRALEGLQERTVFYHHDHLGGTVAATDAHGAVVERSLHYPFGTVRHQQGDAPNYGFTGKELDESVGLVHFGARYLDPWLGRWSAPDPLFALLDANKIGSGGEALGAYAYCGNNPVSATDQDGRVSLPPGTAERLEDAALYASIAGAGIGMITSVVGNAVAQRARGDKVGALRSVGVGLKGAVVGAMSFGASTITSARAYRAEAIAGKIALTTTYKMDGQTFAAFSPEERRVFAERAHQEVLGQKKTVALNGVGGAVVTTAATGGLAAGSLVSSPAAAAFARANVRSLDKHGKTIAPRAARATWRGLKRTPGAIGRGMKRAGGAVRTFSRWMGRGLKRGGKAAGRGLRGLGRSLRNKFRRKKKKKGFLLPPGPGWPTPGRHDLWPSIDHPNNSEHRHALRSAHA